MQTLMQRSRKLVSYLDLRIEGLILGWIAIMFAIALAKAGIGALYYRVSPLEILTMTLPALLCALAPVLGYRIAAGSFPRGTLFAQPSIRLARVGRWKPLDPLSAARDPGFGPTGFMASLIAGILLNVPFRTFEFMLSVPPIPPSAPAWAISLITTMTLDVVVMNFFYMVCFVMALRSIPLFPRMMVFAWALDLTMQFTIAGHVASTPGLPQEVAAPLANLLEGNVKKVLISAAIWLPYLLLSRRVNVTFRRRVEAD